MTDIMCGYPGDRDQVLVAYLYDDIQPAERALFEAHLLTCAACRAELTELRGLRARLGQWAPPVPQRLFAGETAVPSGGRGVWTMARAVPAWAQVAAALLFVGIAAGIAHLDVRYGREGLMLRTGWSNGEPPAGVAPLDAVTSTEAAPWRADLAALERQLRTELRASPTASGAASPAPALTAGSGSRDAEIVRRVRRLVEESERRQQRELALRVAELLRDVNAQRQADLVKIDRSLGLMQNNTGVEVMKQRELLNYLVRASQKQ